MPPPRISFLSSTRCAVCRHFIREAYKHCELCDNNYHKRCYNQAPVCSHPIIEYVLCNNLIE